ncbi:aromatic alcohol reductase [Mycolicibacterium vaccae]|uniref:Isoflavone reductase n=1 Tax=Mycolicibacterium vaccae ATCC 25954 TaxID=1194972 RepID=K0UTJ6_MYCVA|nr:aromatic alcohol reductase [Mycolicibacterium vaccae]ANI42849.1 2'-hydroxyisoflavone reductase [Mycolicibacterium vaccae 95051]EJZ05908.1 isoflavone reductase [Mycolicibacterium vaccae ATCC 25954]
MKARDTESFLIVGAGELGTAVIDALSAQIRNRRSGDTIAVLLRPTSSPSAGRAQLLRELTAAGATVEYGDVATTPAPELADLFGRYDTVVSCLGFAAGAGTQVTLAEAALSARVGRYLPWQFGVDYDLIGRGSPQTLFDEQLDVRDMLRSQNHTDWRIISTGMFTSFLFDPAFGVVDLPSRTVHALGDWDTEVTVTTPEDIGTLTAAVLHAPPSAADKVVYVAGDTLSYGRLADVVEDVLGTEVNRVRWSIEHLDADLATDPQDPMKKYRAVFARGVGVAWPKSATFNARNGIETTTALEWATNNLGPPTAP